LHCCPSRVIRYPRISKLYIITITDVIIADIGLGLVSILSADDDSMLLVLELLDFLEDIFIDDSLYILE
jgi:hypothetical protein